MHTLDHAPVDLHDALGMIFGKLECRDDLSRLRDLGLTRRKGGIAWRDLVGVDHGLAVESHVAALPALAAKALGIGDVVVDAVQYVDAEGVRRPHRGPEARG